MSLYSLRSKRFRASSLRTLGREQKKEECRALTRLKKRATQAGVCIPDSLL